MLWHAAGKQSQPVAGTAGAVLTHLRCGPVSSCCTWSYLFPFASHPVHRLKVAAICGKDSGMGGGYARWLTQFTGGQQELSFLMVSKKEEGLQSVAANTLAQLWPSLSQRQ